MALGGVALLACREPTPPSATTVSEWMRLVGASIARERVEAPAASRAHAYVSIAIYEAHAAVERSGLRSLAGQLNGLWHVPIPADPALLDGSIVAATAARVVLDSLFIGASSPTAASIDTLNRTQIAQRLSAGVPRSVADRSREHGSLLAREIVAWAATDGFAATRNRPWRATGGDGAWTPPRVSGPDIVLAGAPGTDRMAQSPRIASLALEPHWGRLRSFALRYGDECGTGRPPDVAKMDSELRDSMAVLTAEKSAIAAFWADSGTLRSGTRWTVITDSVIQRAADAGSAAERYVFSSVARADAYIAAWKEKYRWLVTRPRAAAQLDSPEYPSEGAAMAGALVTVFARLIGDSVSFTLDGRTVTGFMRAADEASMASVYTGTQFVPSATMGLAQGRCVASRVLGRLITRQALALSAREARR